MPSDPMQRVGESGEPDGCRTPDGGDATEAGELRAAVFRLDVAMASIPAEGFDIGAADRIRDACRVIVAIARRQRREADIARLSAAPEPSAPQHESTPPAIAPLSAGCSSTRATRDMMPCNSAHGGACAAVSSCRRTTKRSAPFQSQGGR